ncbi:facilitated trehalose transporter Tret1 [Apis mellifera caucasica]|uniref:Facilitated trehalose transporter Tret1 n=1 Tax=Apis mellifera TaxID=7460 RepID=A0A7M7G2L1_APIME|nr:facilitated trehalose transporter Tret1 [Apis mellifera]KAG6798490.1 facilitated trehalose transporter Tret1 [Apis mellifera caucasica]KAG9434617.1 facilitated trehalose transporter Tret1 [Apis mellifera carnica]|eukprot:XP_001122483.1 facilitated trehalose transporter Tret1 [Apis mellifera]
MTTASINDNVAEIRKLNQYVGAFVASLGGFALGISLGWNSKASIVLRNYVDASATEIGLIGGILNGGICIGAILIPFIVGRISRTNILFWTMPVLILTWTLMISNRRQKVLLFLIGRLICGICGGVSCVLTPIYVAEIASKEIRGRLLAFFQLLVNCGVMYAFYVAHAIDEQRSVWRYSAICGLACLSIAPTKLLPESPLYYLSRNDEIGAEKSLRWYRGDTYDVQHEINETKRLVLAHSKKFSLRLLKNRRVLRSMVTCFGIILGQHLCGVNMMIFYALMLFETTGSGELTGSEQTLVVGAVQILVCLLAAFLVDVLGRRILLTVSSLFMGLFLILLGWFFSLRDSDPEYDDLYFWMSPTWITLIFAAFNLGLGPISWSLLGDTLPEELKTSVVSMAVAFGWLISMMGTLTFDEMIISLGSTKVMWLSAAICWLIALFCAIVVKDNTGKSLIEIQEEFRIESNAGLEET